MTLALDACHLADCRAALSQCDSDLFDSCVTDPPYGLSREPDIREVLTHWLAGDDYQHKGGGFMGKAWDSFVPGPSYWREVFRVMKPGAHLLAFGGTRTYDLLVIALRLAGFSARDTCSWNFGAGFPKGHNLSYELENELCERREYEPKRWAWFYLSDGERRADKPPFRIPEANEWWGWNTALKPAMELICLARKPISEDTIAQNVCTHGTGAINIDGCRIETEESTERQCGPDSDHALQFRNTRGGIRGSTSGRWPANVLLDEEAAQMLDEQAGERPSGRLADGRPQKGWWDKAGGRSETQEIPASSGPASRFFYVAKASPGERENFVSAERFSGEEISGGGGTQHPKADAYQARKSGRKNCHATVKPIALMRYLCRLVTPPGGIVLDPFAGSASTLIAAHEEGFHYLGFENDPVHHKIAAARLAAAKAQGRLL